MSFCSSFLVKSGKHCSGGVVRLCRNASVYDCVRLVHRGFGFGIVAGLSNVERKSAFHNGLVEKNVDSLGQGHSKA